MDRTMVYLMKITNDIHLPEDIRFIYLWYTFSWGYIKASPFNRQEIFINYFGVFYISMGDIFRFRCLMFLSVFHPKSRWPINEKLILKYDGYRIWATERSQPHQRTTSQRRFVLWNHNIVLLSNYLLFSTSPCTSIWGFVYGTHHATDHIMTKFITYATKCTLLRHRNDAAIRAVQTVLLTAPSTEATCMRNMPACCNVPVPLMTIYSLVHLTNDTEFFAVFLASWRQVHLVNIQAVVQIQVPLLCIHYYGEKALSRLYIEEFAP